MSQQPSGWYDDPSTPDTLRYWDGVTWTSHTAPKKSPTLPQGSGGVPVRADSTGAAQTQGVPTATTPLPQGSGWQDQSSQTAYGRGGQASQPGQGLQGGQGAPPYAGAPANAAWMQPVKTTADGVPLASWGRRLGAWLLDGIILTVLSVLLSRLVAPDLWSEMSRMMDIAATGDQATFDAALTDFTPVVTAATLRLGIAQFLLVLVYCLAFWTTIAQTPGKLAVGISVRRADRPGPLDLGTAVRRRLLSAVQLLPVVSGLYAIIVLVYCLAFWTTIAQTPGKLAVGISVRRADRPGPLDLGTAVRRRLLSALQLLPVVSGLYLILFLVDYLWPLWDDKRQALHDKVAATQVVMGKQPRSKA